MVGQYPQVVWSKAANGALERIYKKISEDSIQNAEKVKQEIIKATAELPKHPERYAPDKYKKNNSGAYRAFEKLNIRVSYKYNENTIQILRIRHVKQRPQSY